MSAETWRKVKNFLGIPLEEEEMDSLGGRQTATAFMEPQQEDPRLRQRRPKGVGDKTGNLGQGQMNNIIGLNSSLSQSEMLIVEPKSFDEALDIVESLRSRKAIIINLKGLEQEQAQRLIDFVAGATHALDGNQERVGEGIFLFSPSNVVINSLGADQPWLNRDARDLFWRVK